MIEILTPDDVSKIKDCYIAEYIKNLLTNLLTQTSDCSLETVGGIFYVENEKDFDNYKKFGLSSKITAVFSKKQKIKFRKIMAFYDLI